jgi:GNAT superfamily N-acetyltransferase
MRRIEYKNPRSNIERGELPRHTVDMVNHEGLLMGRAGIEYNSKPVSHYQLTDLHVEPEFRNQGIASEIMQWFEDWLKKKHKIGFLVDGILPDQPAAGFYERRNWLPVPGGRGHFVFNLPETTNIDIFRGIEMRTTWPQDRIGNLD